MTSSDPDQEPGHKLDAAAWLATNLSLSYEHAEQVLLLTHWVEHERLIARYGYPKDNVMPAPLEERFSDLEYLSQLLLAAREEEDIPSPILESLTARRDLISKI